ncbi:hypothetical protein [Paenibacillus glycanilyticus]|uniref:hypothetical protein n=1 Tax=Paenibacillus glycanilyticus TaxID=126569 RepID=UPI0024E08CB6|nr:hypothetical protein [Paenibacillus glycanilyticus]
MFDPIKGIDTDKPAFIYGDTLNEQTSLQLKGDYDKKNHGFSGWLMIGDHIKLEHVLITSGFSLISYVGKERTEVGQVFFDYKTARISFEVTDPELYKRITSKSYDGVSKLIISSPASNAEEAKRVKDELVRIDSEELLSH